MKTRFKGSFTVEASLLMPMILIIIILLIYTGFYYHDRAVIQSMADQAAVRYAEAYLHSTNLWTGKIDYERRVAVGDRLADRWDGETEEYIKQYMSETVILTAARVKDIFCQPLYQIIIPSLEVEVRIIYDLQMPFSFLKYLFGETVSVSGKTKQMDYSIWRHIREDIEQYQ